MDLRIVPANPNSECFGCSQTNPHGLQLSFVQVAEHTVECRWTPPAHVCGAPGIVHGGIQAAALDETIGFAAHTLFEGERDVVTVEMSLRYRRPVRAGEPLVVRASVERHEPPYIFLAGSIVGGGDDQEVLTLATARFKDIT